MSRTVYPLASSCRVRALPRSTLSYRAQLQYDQELRRASAAVAQPSPTNGRRMAAQVRRAPYRLRVNRMRARRVMRRVGLSRRTRPHTRRTTNSQHGFRRFPNLVAVRAAGEPDDLWVSASTDVRWGDEFSSLAGLMAMFTRDIRGRQLGRTRGQE